MAGFQNTAPAVGPDYTGPAGSGLYGYCLGETVDRALIQTLTAAPASGTLSLASLVLPAGVTISQLGWVSGNVGATAPTHQWLALFDNNRNMLAATADQGAAAIGGNAEQGPYAIATTAGGAATTFTTTYTGRYYIGLLLAATTTNAEFAGFPFSALGGITFATPARGGASNTGLSAVPAFPFQANVPASGPGPYAFAA